MIYARTQAELGDAVGVSRRSIVDWAKLAGFPRRGRRGWNILRVKLWRERRQAAHGPASAPDSPALEEWRRWKTKRAELDYLILSGKWLAADEVATDLGVFSAIIRKGLDDLQRRFGREAADVVLTYIDKAAATFERLHAEAVATGNEASAAEG